jgi:hypothetical protein
MLDFTKLAEYLDSFSTDDENYDKVCYIKSKIASDMQDRETINNGEEEELDDTDITMSTPDQQASENVEGELMSDAFKEFEVMDKLKEEKERIHMPGEKTQNDNTATNSFNDVGLGDSMQNKHASLFDLLKSRLSR